MVQRALLVGIDEYPNPINNLNSCVKDTQAFHGMLVGKFGFPEEEIEQLHNTDATLANVRAALDRLFAGAGPGDHLVYFESSHGYRYPKGDTMVEVLCLYDAFLEDTEFAGRTQQLPRGVLTVVLDACHSGGMNKEFFPSDSEVVVARSKVFQPDPILAATYSQSGPMVSKFKLFGRTRLGSDDVGALAKAFTPPPANAPVLPSAKDATGADLNGLVFAACLADQTAAAGSPATNGLSAFTFALTDQVDTTSPVSDLCTRVVNRLEALRMHQTPIVDVPFDQQMLALESFILMQGESAPAPPDQGLDDFASRLRTMLLGSN